MASLRPHAQLGAWRHGVSAIGSYLAQLEQELRVKRAPRRRLIKEVAEHLRDSADEIAAAGMARAEAEERAIARFGAAALVARRFARAVASTSARTALVAAVTACTGYAVAAAFFILAAPTWLRDFPQGAPSMPALQIAAAALVLSGVRAVRCRKTLLIDEARLRFVANGTAIATAVVAGAAGVELVLALTRPAPAPWADEGAIIAVYAVAAIAALAATLFAVGTVVRVRALAALPRPSGDELPDTAALLVDDVAVAVPRLQSVASLVTSRPVLACAVTAVCAFIAMTAVAILDPGSGEHRSTLGGAAATGLFEAVAVVAGYLTFGRALGLRRS